MRTRSFFALPQDRELPFVRGVRPAAAPAVHHPCRRAPHLAGRLGPLALFALLSAIFLWQPLVTGETFLPTELSFHYDPVWQAQERPPLRPVAQNPLLSDVSYYYYPYAHFAMDRLRSGHFPLWNPYILAGAPFFAATQAAVLDPINLLSALAGPAAYWTGAAWLRLTLLGWTMYGLLRALGRSRVAGLGAGSVFMICGFVVVWLNYSVVTTLAWLPGLFWATTRLLQTGRPAWLVGTAFAWAGILFGGHPETQFLIGGFWAAYSLYSVQTRPWAWAGPTTHRLARLGGAALGGLGLASVQWVPFVLFLQHSSAPVARAVPVAPFDLSKMVLRLLVLGFPNFTGTPLEQNYWVPAWLNFNEQTGYIGLLAMGLAGVGGVYWVRRDRLVLFWAASAAIALLLASRAPGFHLIKLLPLFNVGHGVRWLLIWSFCGAVLAGYGLDALGRCGPRTSGLRATSWGFVGAALLALGFLVLSYLGLQVTPWERLWQPVRDHLSLGHLFAPEHPTLYEPVLFLAAGAGVVLARWRGWLRASTVATLLIMLLYADLWTFGSRYNPVVPPERIYPPNAALRYLTTHLGHERLIGTRNALRPNVAMVFALRDLRGYEDVIDAQFDGLYGPVLARLGEVQGTEVELTRDQQRLLSVAAVRYVLTPRRPRVAGQPSAYHWVEEAGRVALYENLDALPRAYVVFQATVQPNPASAVTALLAPRHDPHQTVIVGAGGTPLSGPPLAAGAIPVRWVQDDPEQIELAAALPAPGYLVLSDTYMPGWRATVDGQPAPLLQANGVYRAVALPRGSHQVRFTYQPPEVGASAALSGGTLLVLLGWLGVTWWRGRPHR